MSIILLAKIGPVNPPIIKDNKNPIIREIGVIENKQLDQIVHNRFNNLIPVGIAIIEVGDVKYALVSTSNPTINIWWPHTIRPDEPVEDNAMIMLSLPEIIKLLDLDEIGEIKPNAGGIEIWASGWPENQKRCWNDDKSDPFSGSENELLKCLSLVVVVVRAAETGKEIDDEIGVGEIDRIDKSI